MGRRIIELKLATNYSDSELKSAISKELKLNDFVYHIINKSLDARKKSAIHWLLRIDVVSNEIQGGEDEAHSALQIPYLKRNKRVVVVGSGPAGFFAAFVLQKAGFDTMILERGCEVDKREKGIKEFERGGLFQANANYSFGEGGAGTFSDGKLTSRSKHISLEREFILQSYVDAGAPEEILYLAHPHVGSDNLKVVVANLRHQYQELGGKIHFETTMTDIEVQKGKVVAVITGNNAVPTDFLIVAPGHSAYETYRMLMQRGVPFRTKNFAIGCRAEHEQVVINKAQWGIGQLPGVKAAEYRLTSEADGKHAVYSFCMCPGGTVVPAATYAHQNIVNGMSYYQRNARFANAACVAGLHPNELAGKQVTPLDALRQLEELEASFFNYSNSYKAPFCTVEGFLNGKEPKGIPPTSYPLGLTPAPLWKLLPKPVVQSMRVGLLDFDRKLSGYKNGILLGLESKTSAPIQVLREQNGLCTGFDNLFVVGEGSGYAGGIISSAADGIKAALKLL